MNEWLEVPARKDSKSAKRSAISRAPTSRQLTPPFPPRAKYRFVRSCGSILNEIIPATENIMESSQQTPMSRINVVDSLDTDQRG